MARDVTIDSAGRLVIPKDVRERHGLAAGVRLRLDEDGDRIVLRPVSEEPLAVEKSGLLVFRGRLVGAVPDHRQLREDRFDELGKPR